MPVAQVGAGLSAQLGIATETTNGTAATVTHFYEFNSESLKLKKNVVQGVGLRAGGLYMRQSRRVVGSWAAAGGFNADASYNSWGLLFEHMLGAFNPGATGGTNNPIVAQQASSTAYLQTYAPGSLAGKTFTAQVGKPQSTGTVAPFTYVGCKVSDWSLSAEVNKYAVWDVNIDAWQELTLDNPTGTTAGPALASATYTAGEQFFHFREATLFGGGTLATSGGITTLSTPTALARVTKVSLKCENPLDTGRYFFGGQGGTGGSTVAGVKSEQLENNYRKVTGSMEAEFYSNASYYDVFAGDTSLSLQIIFTGPTAIASTYYPTLAVLIPVIRLNDTSPVVPGPGILNMTLPFEGLDDETDNQVQLQYMSTDMTP